MELEGKYNIRNQNSGVINGAGQPEAVRGRVGYKRYEACGKGEQ